MHEFIELTVLYLPNEAGTGKLPYHYTLKIVL